MGKWLKMKKNTFWKNGEKNQKTTEKIKEKHTKKRYDWHGSCWTYLTEHALWLKHHPDCSGHVVVFQR